jgi:hypothetical protein
MIRRAVTFLALIAILLQLHSATNACGPSYLQPVFVSENSPDLPFDAFAAGNIGIVKPTFGRKTLLIAYRYLNGGSFSADEQKQMVSVLKGSEPEDDGAEAVKAWIELRKQISGNEELPEIYRERNSAFSGYDYFPNCAKNAFEVAAATLKDRVASYGADDAQVREWIRGQDQVFENCSGGAPTIPQQLAAGTAVWLQKDRDYQIAAAFFYSLQFDDALARFERIADDAESNWQATAEYLIARTLVRQASLTKDQQTRTALYARAENQLAKLIASSNEFRVASRKLLGLVRYRTQPQARFIELSEILTRDGASLDLRQDAIDYVWLLGKFEGEILTKEHERREALRKKQNAEDVQNLLLDRFENKVEKDDEITVTLMPKFADGTADYENLVNLQVKFATPESEIFRLLEARMNRSLGNDERTEVRERVKWALEYRKWRVSYNRQLTSVASTYEGCYYCYEIKLQLSQLPEFLVTNDLSDWIFTMQLEGPDTYEHALMKWRDTESPAWLVAALAKAEIGSSELAPLMRAAERVSFDSPAFPTIAFNLVRINLAMGRNNAAQEILDRGRATRLDELPRSAQNEFQQQRMKLSGTVAEFLKYAARKPVAFYDEGLFASVRDIVEAKKSYWGDDGSDERKEEYEKRIELEYKDFLTDDLRFFDDDTADILDRHFSLKLLQQAASDPKLSTYLRHRLTVMLFTRALLLNNREIALQVAPDVISMQPEMAPLVEEYIRAKGGPSQEHAALYLMLKSPILTPFMSGSQPHYVLLDEEYYLESAWWCAPSETEYRNGEEVKKNVPAPSFIDLQELNAAKQQFAELTEIGDAKSYLGQKVLEWARKSPTDLRIPEALFIAVKANENYKYGCGGWEHDDEIREEATKLLRERYPNSSWTAKLDVTDQ